MKYLLTSLLILLMSLTACRKKQENSDYSPKPKGYPRIDLPKALYQPLTEKHPYSFEYSKYAVIKPDTFRGAEPHWIFVHYPTFKASIELTYKPVMNDKIRLAHYIDDAHKLTAKHNIKASSIEDYVLKTPSGKKVGLMELDGEVPSYLQFYTTDSTKHFLRGALYFNTATARDSLSPIIEYIKKDMIHLLNTLEWKP
jgi:gliding motility-associated lipoprotein GldD